MSRIVPPKGPFPNSLAIVGEAPGKNEEAYGKPFIGASGAELDRMLEESGINPKLPYYTNVFKIRPPENKVEHFFVPKKLAHPGLPPLSSGKYLPSSGVCWLDLLRAELSLTQPKLVLALGNTALWALTGKSGITKYRGVFLEGLLHSAPVLSTFHPSAILRTWSNRVIALADLDKARTFIEGNSALPEANHSLHINPRVSDFPFFLSLALAAPELGVDIETSRGQITMIGFAVSPLEAFCIPFWDPDLKQSYWSSAEDEVLAWKFVRQILALPNLKVGHNFLYDLQYLCANRIAKIAGLGPDTMLLHHALHPELQKGLGFLGATYLNQGAWKQMRHRKGDEVVKRDE